VKQVWRSSPQGTWSHVICGFMRTGQALGKDAPEVMTKLVQAHGTRYGFVKEMLFRSLEHQNLASAFRLIQELRKRVRQREKVDKERADLVEQEKLVL
jgi:nucleosome binding factor SPN SPT16 subunit